MDLRRQMSVLRAWLWLLVLAVVLGGGSAFVVSNALPKSYEARAQLIVGQSLSSNNPDYNQLLAWQRLSQTYASIATSRRIAESVIKDLHLNMTPEQVVGELQATATNNAALVYIVVTDGNPQRAADIANGVAKALLSVTPAVSGQGSELLDTVNADISATRDQINRVQGQIDSLNANSSLTAAQQQQASNLQQELISLRATYVQLLSYRAENGAQMLSVFETAVTPTVPSAPRPLLNAALAALLALLVATGFAFLVEYLDDSIKSVDDLREVVDVPALGTLPVIEGDARREDLYRLVTLLYPKSPASEAYRTLRTNIQFAAVDRSIKTLLVTSSVPEEGKTTTAANLAIAFAQAGQSVLLVDCDLRKPSLHTLFQLENERGLSTLFRQNEDLQDLLRSTEQPSLWVLTSGPVPPNPSELLGSHRMAGILTKLAEAADIVVLDTPPLQAVTDAAVLSTKTDGTLLVVRAGRTRRGVVRHAREALERTGATVVGVAINRIRPGASAGGYGYYYYHYYSDRDEAPATPSRRRVRRSSSPKRGSVQPPAENPAIQK